jgi:hypothetical protein
MSFIDVTAALAKANGDNVVLAAPTDESLNAGAFLPDEPVGDVLTNEVPGDPNVILDALNKLNEPVATESIFNNLDYLRKDMLSQRGMNQKIATEAMTLLPNFGQGRPVNFYSRHVSPTGYSVALEEIEAGMQSDLLSTIAGQINRLESMVATPGNGFVLENLDFKRRADQVVNQGCLLEEFATTLTTRTAFQWDDATFRGCVVDPTQNTMVPAVLGIPVKVAHGFGEMDAYYTAHNDAPAMLEIMESYLKEWLDLFVGITDQLKQTDTKISSDTPKALTVYFGGGGKSTTLVNIADVFRSAADKVVDPDPSMLNTLTLVKAVGNAAQQARVDDIMSRGKAFVEVATQVAAVLKGLSSALQSSPNAEHISAVHKLVGEFATASQALNAGYTEMLRWCVNASIATSYAGTLAAKVGEVAWKAAQQCRETIQMSEHTYVSLKVRAELMQAALTQNAM